MQHVGTRQTVWMLWASLLIGACSILTSFLYVQQSAVAEAMETGSSSSFTFPHNQTQPDSEATPSDDDLRQKVWLLAEDRLCYGATFYLSVSFPLPDQDGTCGPWLDPNLMLSLSQVSCQIACEKGRKAYATDLLSRAIASGLMGPTRCIKWMDGRVKFMAQASFLPKNLCSWTCRCTLAVYASHIWMPMATNQEGQKVEVSPYVSMFIWDKAEELKGSLASIDCLPGRVGSTLILPLPKPFQFLFHGHKIVYERVQCPSDDKKCYCKDPNKSHVRKITCPLPVPVNSLRQPSSSQQYDEGLCQTQQQFFENPALSMSDKNGLPYVPPGAYLLAGQTEHCSPLTLAEMQACRMRYPGWEPSHAAVHWSGQNGHSGSAQSSCNEHAALNLASDFPAPHALATHRGSSTFRHSTTLITSARCLSSRA